MKSIRVIDFVIAISLILICIPLFILLTIIIYLQDFKNPLFIQKRMGKDKKEFKMIKLRSMKIHHDPIYQTTQKNDPRITRIGRIIRKTSLDELPQLWNIVLGQMSFIGPRPVPKVEINQFPKELWELRHTIRPGISGLAQINSKSNKNFSLEDQHIDEFEMINTFNLLNYFKLFLSTFHVLLKNH